MFMPPPMDTAILVAITGGTPFSPLAYSPFSWYSFRTGYVTLSGSDIVTAIDRSGNGRTLDAGGTGGPTLGLDAGGAEAALFSASGQLLRNGTFNMPLGGGWTIFALYRGVNNSAIIQIGTANVNSGVVMLCNLVGTEIQCYTKGGSSRLIQNGLTPGDAVNACHWSDGTDEKLYLSGSLVQTDLGYIAPSNNAVLSVGNTDNYGSLNGSIRELVFFDRPLTTPQLAAMAAYMDSLEV